MLQDTERVIIAMLYRMLKEQHGSRYVAPRKEINESMQQDHVVICWSVMLTVITWLKQRRTKK